MSSSSSFSGLPEQSDQQQSQQQQQQQQLSFLEREHQQFQQQQQQQQFPQLRQNLDCVLQHVSSPTSSSVPVSLTMPVAQLHAPQPSQQQLQQQQQQGGPHHLHNPQQHFQHLHHHKIRPQTSTSLSSTPSSATTPNTSSNTTGAAATTKRRGPKLNDDDRRKICEYYINHPGTRQETIASNFGVERSTISKILKNRAKWLRSVPGSTKDSSIDNTSRPSSAASLNISHYNEGSGSVPTTASTTSFNLDDIHSPSPLNEHSIKQTYSTIPVTKRTRRQNQHHHPSHHHSLRSRSLSGLTHDSNQQQQQQSLSPIKGKGKNTGATSSTTPATAAEDSFDTKSPTLRSLSQQQQSDHVQFSYRPFMGSPPPTISHTQQQQFTFSSQLSDNGDPSSRLSTPSHIPDASSWTQILPTSFTPQSQHPQTQLQQPQQQQQQQQHLQQSHHCPSTPPAQASFLLYQQQHQQLQQQQQQQQRLLQRQQQQQISGIPAFHPHAHHSQHQHHTPHVSLNMSPSSSVPSTRVSPNVLPYTPATAYTTPTSTPMSPYSRSSTIKIPAVTQTPNTTPSNYNPKFGLGINNLEQENLDSVLKVQSAGLATPSRQTSATSLHSINTNTNINTNNNEESENSGDNNDNQGSTNTNTDTNITMSAAEDTTITKTAPSTTLSIPSSEPWAGPIINLEPSTDMNTINDSKSRPNKDSNDNNNDNISSSIRPTGLVAYDSSSPLTTAVSEAEDSLSKSAAENLQAQFEQHQQQQQLQQHHQQQDQHQLRHHHHHPHEEQQSATLLRPFEAETEPDYVRLREVQNALQVIFNYAEHEHSQQKSSTLISPQALANIVDVCSAIGVQLENRGPSPFWIKSEDHDPNNNNRPRPSPGAPSLDNRSEVSDTGDNNNNNNNTLVGTATTVGTVANNNNNNSNDGSGNDPDNPNMNTNLSGPGGADGTGNNNNSLSNYHRHMTIPATPESASATRIGPSVGSSLSTQSQPQFSQLPS